MRIANNRPDIQNARARYARLERPSPKPLERQRLPADRFDAGRLTPGTAAPAAYVSEGVTNVPLAADLGVSPTQETALAKRGLTDTTAERIVADAYQKLLLRAPDAEGMRTHTELANAALRDGDPPDVVQREIEASIRKSDEYQSIEATQQSFENVLGRRPEERGYWHDQALAMRAKGMSHEDIRGELEAAHRRSDEYRLGHPEEVVGEIYRDELMRDPDAAGLRTWTDKAKQLRDEGKSASEIEQTLRNDIGGSDEAQVIDRVNQSFEEVLGRRPEDKGHWHEEALKWRADGMGLDEIDERLRDAHRQSDEYRAAHPKPVAPPPSNDASLSSSAVMDSAQRVAGEINSSGGYVFNGVDDCWGFVRRAMNPLLTSSGLPQVPVNDYGSAQAARDWKPIANWSQVPVGTPLSTHQGHKWGDDWHGAIFAGVKNGLPYMWDNSSGTGGASLRPVITSGPYALDWMHTPTAGALG